MNHNLPDLALATVLPASYVVAFHLLSKLYLVAKRYKHYSNV